MKWINEINGKQFLTNLKVNITKIEKYIIFFFSNSHNYRHIHSLINWPIKEKFKLRNSKKCVKFSEDTKNICYISILSDHIFHMLRVATLFFFMRVPVIDICWWCLLWWNASFCSSVSSMLIQTPASSFRLISTKFWLNIYFSIFYE